MIKEATNWFLNRANFVLVPSFNNNLSGDLGMRSTIIYNNDLPGLTLYNLAYSEKEFFRYSNNNKINFLLYLIDGTIANPIYFSDSTNGLLSFENFDLSQYNTGDKVSIYSVDDLSISISENAEIVSIDILNNTIQINDVTVNTSYPRRYKVVNTSGTKYGYTQRLLYTDILNNKLKLGNKFYSNANT